MTLSATRASEELEPEPLVIAQPLYGHAGPGERVQGDPALEEEVIDIAASWQQLEELRRAAGRKGRWSQALSLVIATSRVEMVAALHATRKYVASEAQRLREDLDCAVLMSLGALLYQALRTLQQGGLALLGRAWRWSAGRLEEARGATNAVIGETRHQPHRRTLLNLSLRTWVSRCVPSRTL